MRALVRFRPVEASPRIVYAHEVGCRKPYTIYSEKPAAGVWRLWN